MSGSLPEEEYADLLRKTGFVDVAVERIRTYRMTDADGRSIFGALTDDEAKAADGRLGSAIGRAKKPGAALAEGREYALRSATPGDLGAVLELVEACGLTSEGIGSQIGDFAVITLAGETDIAGCVGLEWGGGAAMIRSLAVRQSARKFGFGERLVQWAAERARGAGAERVVLLTETAPRFFARLGFAAVERSSLPQALLESSSVAPA